MNGIQFGRRVSYWRSRRRMTQATFASLMGKSLRWVEDLEAGRVQRDPQLSVMLLAASKFGITLERLLDDQAVACAGQSELAAVRTALHRHDVITGTGGTLDEEPVPISLLDRALVHGRSAFQAGHFAQLGTAIPRLLVDASQAARHHVGDEQLQAFRLLSLSLELTEAALIKWGDTPAAVLAGHRAVAAAERSEDPVIQASAARHLADALTNDGQAADAVAFITAAADRLHGELLRRGPDGLSVLGMLYLKAAMAQAAAAESDDRNSAALARRVPDHLNEAAEHARHVAPDEDRLWTSFNKTNVSLYRVAAHVQLSEGSDAVAVAAGIPAPALSSLPPERRAHLLADRAIGEKQAGLTADAVDTLLEAERLAPEEVQCRPRTRALVEDLRLLGTGTAERRLRALANRCGLPG